MVQRACTTSQTHSHRRRVKFWNLYLEFACLGFAWTWLFTNGGVGTHLWS